MRRFRRFLLPHHEKDQETDDNHQNATDEDQSRWHTVLPRDDATPRREARAATRLWPKRTGLRAGAKAEGLAGAEYNAVVQFSSKREQRAGLASIALLVLKILVYVAIAAGAVYLLIHPLVAS